jgi:ribulose kinase
MIKIWGRLVKNNKTIKDTVVVSNMEGTYQDNLKNCLNEICNEFDISKPYWLPTNMEEYNKRAKTIFNAHNFIEDIDFDKFIISEIDLKDKEK